MQGLSDIKRIGILTSGGDAPGMNPAIRAVVRAAFGEGICSIGIRRGFAGLINGDVIELTADAVSGLNRRGGTILYTARCPEFLTADGVEKGAKECKYLGIDGLVCIGGDGTFRGAKALHEYGVRVVGIPGTIDNDMGCTEYTLGFDTACNTAIECIDKLRDTGQSHERVSVVEVMGRNAGHLALYVSIASGASAVLLPEKPVDLEHDVIEVIRAGCIHGRRHHVVVVAEGVGNATDYARQIEAATGLEARVTVLGHVQRGGTPSVRDRTTACLMGVCAVDALLKHEGSRATIVVNGRVVDIDLGRALDMTKELDEDMFNAADRLDDMYKFRR